MQRGINSYTRLFETMKSCKKEKIQSEEDCIQLQEDLHTLCEWSRTLGMELNGKKMSCVKNLESREMA